MLLALITSLSDNRQVSIGALMCTMVILLTIHYIAGKVYNKWYLNALEVTFLLNLILLGYFGGENVKIPTIILLSISLVMFLGIVLFHIALRIKPDISIDLLHEAVKKLSTSKKRSTTFTSSRDTADDVQSVQTHKPTTSDLRELLLDADFADFVGDNY